MEKLNVAIVDDNPLILNTLDELINAEDGLSVIGKADNGADAINMIVDTTPAGISPENVAVMKDFAKNHYGQGK